MAEVETHIDFCCVALASARGAAGGSAPLGRGVRRRPRGDEERLGELTVAFCLTGPRPYARAMEEDLAELLVSRPAGCGLWPEQTEGPYHREAPRERTDITEDRPGSPLRLGLRLLVAQAATPLAGVLVEVWHADHEGRYSGFQPFQAEPGQVVTSESVPREIVAPGETFLRGAQRTDEQGMCAFRTIYPGWYSSRTVHIHLRAHLGERTATTQLYFRMRSPTGSSPSRRTQVGHGETPRTTRTASTRKKVVKPQSSTWWVA